jgi:hypothetical protein
VELGLNPDFIAQLIESEEGVDVALSVGGDITSFTGGVPGAMHTSSTLRGERLSLRESMDDLMQAIAQRNARLAAVERGATVNL